MDQIENINTTAEETIAIEEQTVVVDGAPEVAQDELTLEQIVDAVLDSLGLTTFTMYQVAKALNLVLETIDATKGFDDEGAPAAYRVRPQMVYQYNKNKMVVKGKQVEQADLAQARAFVIKFASKFTK
jgi:hypothetical protein